MKKRDYYRPKTMEAWVNSSKLYLVTKKATKRSKSSQKVACWGACSQILILFDIKIMDIVDRVAERDTSVYTSVWE